MGEFTNVGRADEVGEGQIKPFEVAGRQIAVARTAGSLHAFSDICTHKGCSLSTGELDGTEIECECHGSVFDVASGAVINGPAAEPIATFPVREDDGNLSIEV